MSPPPGSEAAPNPRLRRAGRIALAAAVAGLFACWALALLGPESGPGLWASRSLMAVLMLTAVVACAVRAPHLGRDRLAWRLIAAGLGFWLLGNLFYWAGDQGSDIAVYPWVTDAWYLAYYLCLALGLHAMAGADSIRLRSSFGLVVAMLGLASLWAWLVTSPSFFGSDDGLVAQAVAYPVLDLVLVGATLLVLGARGWTRDRQLLALLAGLTITTATDTLYGLDLLTGLDVAETTLNPGWATGVFFIGVGPWLQERPIQSDPDDRLSLRFAVAAAAVALAILAIDHFDRISVTALVLSTLTLLAASFQIALLYRQMTRARIEAEAATVRSARALALTVDAKDRATHSHSDRVAHIVALLAREFRLGDLRTERLVLAGHLHDIGKISVPEAVLMKPSRLTDSEYELIKRHPAEGAHIVATAGLTDVAEWIRHHHERWDGGGYPDGLTGEEIPLESRLLGVADAVDAMLSDRPYRRGLPLEAVERELSACSGTQFDPGVANTILQLIQAGELDTEGHGYTVESLERELQEGMARTGSPADA